MTLKEYIESEILPQYDHFDTSHQRDHALKVIEESMRLARFYDVDLDMVYAIAAFHDTGLVEGRELHHLVSGQMVRKDVFLNRYFEASQVEIMAQAVEDHRASSKHGPRSVYGRIVAEADRDIIPLKIIRRTVQYGLSHYPALNKEGHWARTVEHLDEKYAEGGYLKLYIPQSQNAERLEELRAIIRDISRLRSVFEEIFAQEIKNLTN